jgi:hypothetical protein
MLGLYAGGTQIWLRPYAPNKLVVRRKMDMAGKMNKDGHVLISLLQTTRLYAEKMQAISSTEHATHTAVCRLLNIH